MAVFMVRCSLLLFNISGTTEAVQTRKPDTRAGQVSKTPPSIKVILNPIRPDTCSRIWSSA